MVEVPKDHSLHLRSQCVPPAWRAAPARFQSATRAFTCKHPFTLAAHHDTTATTHSSPFNRRHNLLIATTGKQHSFLLPSARPLRETGLTTAEYHESARYGGNPALFIPTHRRLPRCLPCCPVFSKSAIADNRWVMATAYNSPTRNRCWTLGWIETMDRLVDRLVVPLPRRQRERMDVAVNMLLLCPARNSDYGVWHAVSKGRQPRPIYLCAPSRHHPPASHKAVLDVIGSALSYSGSGAVSPTPDIHPLYYMLF